jgi:hypothetical protein
MAFHQTLEPSQGFTNGFVIGQDYLDPHEGAP